MSSRGLTITKSAAHLQLRRLTCTQHHSNPAGKCKMALLLLNVGIIKRFLNTDLHAWPEEYRGLCGTARQV